MSCQRQLSGLDSRPKSIRLKIMLQPGKGIRERFQSQNSALGQPPRRPHQEHSDIGSGVDNVPAFRPKTIATMYKYLPEDLNLSRTKTPHHPPATKWNVEGKRRIAEI